MNKLDTATALARVEKRFFLGSLASAYPTGVRFIHTFLFFRCICIVCWIIHEVRASLEAPFIQTLLFPLHFIVLHWIFLDIRIGIRPRILARGLRVFSRFHGEIVRA